MQHSRLRAALLVGVGGALGTLLRALIGAAVPEPNGVPLGMLAINTVGSLALGVLLGALGKTLATPRTERMRLLVGTGLIGGFTSYSALALGAFELIAVGEVFVGAAYAAGTVAVGMAAAGFGLQLGSAFASGGGAGGGAGGAGRDDGSGGDDGRPGRGWGGA